MRFHANGAPRIGLAFEADNGGANGGGDGGTGGQGGGQGDPPGDGKQPASGGGGGDGDPADVAGALETLKKVRKERDDALREIKKRDDALLSESEKLTRRAEEAEKERDALRGTIRQSRVERAVRAADRSLSLGLHDSDLVAELLKLGDDDFDGDGQPIAKKVEAAVKALVAQRPYLAGPIVRRPGDGDAGAGGTSNGGGNDMNALLRAARRR